MAGRLATVHCTPVRNVSSHQQLDRQQGFKMIDEKSIKIVNTIFERLVAINPAFKQAWPTDVELAAAKREWVIAFEDSGIKDLHLIKKGLSKVRLDSSPFPPSPGRFMAWCLPDHTDIGAPDLESAYKEACLQAHPQSWKKDWSHAAVKHAYQRTGNHTFLNSPADKAFDKFEAHYKQACLDYASGKIMEQIEPNKFVSKSDLNKAETVGNYEFSRPGVLKLYEKVSSLEECISICEKILGKGDARLREFISQLERRYTEQLGAY